MADEHPEKTPGFKPPKKSDVPKPDDPQVEPPRTDEIDEPPRDPAPEKEPPPVEPPENT